MTINYMIRFKNGARDRIALYLLALKQNIYVPTLNLSKVLRIFFLQLFGLNATPTIQPAEATTGTTLPTGINTRATTATIQTTSAGNLDQLH